MNDPRGSIWRKWDLHVHTPASVLYNNFEGTDEAEKWDRYLQKLGSLRGISVLGLTDYFSIDGYKKVLAYLHDNPDNLKNIDLFLSNVELRILPVTNESGAINLHVIFSPDEEIIDNLESQFFSNLEFSYQNVSYKCTRSDLVRLGKAYLNNNRENEQRAYKAGAEQFKTDLTSLKSVFAKNEKLRNNSLIIVSNSGSDGASGLQHSSLAATRHEIYRFADAIFSGNPTDRNYFLGYGADDQKEILRRYGALKPCIHGSDAHELGKICQPELDRFTWIKADPTFGGLKQIIYEPEARVKIQETNPGQDHKKPFFFKIDVGQGYIFEKNKPQFARNEIDLNRDLIAIIGGRGTGKSLLLDAIKKTFDKTPATKDGPRFAKINNSLDFKTAYFKEEGPPSMYSLPEVNNLDYLHVQQGEVKDIVEDASRLDAEIKKLIGIGKPTTKLYIEDEKKQAAIQIIVNTEKWLRRVDDFGNKINDVTTQKEERKTYEELIATITTAENKALIAQYRKNSILIDFLSKKSSAIDELLLELDATKMSLTRKIESINTVWFEVDVNDAINDAIKAFIAQNTDTFALKPIMLHAGELDIIVAKKEMTNKQQQKLTEILGQDYCEDIEDIFEKSKYLKGTISPVDFNMQRKEAQSIKEDAKRSIQELESANTTIREKFKEENITEEVATLLGKVDQYQAAIDEINSKIKIIESRKKSLSENYTSLFDMAEKFKEDWEQAKQDIEQKWKQLKDGESEGQSPQQQLIHKLLADIEIRAEIHFDDSVFYNELQKCLDMRRFRSVEGTSPQEGMEKAFDVRCMESFLRLIKNEAVISLEDGMPITLKELIDRDGYFVADGQSELLRTLFLQENVNEYVRVLSKSTYKNKEPFELSVGQRGTFYVCLKLATDTFGLPFVFDQPEDDLDNDFIANELVKMFTDIKKYRQVIIVTHNANLCVNADADQIIVAANKDEILSYATGALENPNIRESVYNILEGGEEAFLKREQKYAFSGTTS